MINIDFSFCFLLFIHQIQTIKIGNRMFFIEINYYLIANKFSIKTKSKSSKFRLFSHFKAHLSAYRRKVIYVFHFIIV